MSDDASALVSWVEWTALGEDIAWSQPERESVTGAEREPSIRLVVAKR